MRALLDDFAMSSARSALVGASIGAVATILGAAIGVTATLYVSTTERASATASEVRSQRGEVYLGYMRATYRYASAQIEFDEERAAHCVFTLDPPGPTKPFCGGFESTPGLEKARVAWLDADDLVRIYGSDEAREAASDWSELLVPEVVTLAPTSMAMQGIARDKDKPLAEYNAAEAAFRVVMCSELSAGESCAPEDILSEGNLAGG